MSPFLLAFLWWGGPDLKSDKPFRISCSIGMYTSELKIYPKTNTVKGTWSNPNDNVKDKEITYMSILENKPGWFLIGAKPAEHDEALDVIWKAFSGKPRESQTYKIFRTNHYGVRPGTVHVTSNTHGLLPMDCKVRKL